MSWSLYKIRSIPLSEQHWTTDYIPISYTRSNRKHSRTFYLSDESRLSKNYPTLFFIVRVYVLYSGRVELGDIWLEENLRGKRDPRSGKKISRILLERTIQKIWRTYPGLERIYLRVHRSNRPAISLYESLGFIAQNNLQTGFFTVDNPGILMVREKRKL